MNNNETLMRFHEMNYEEQLHITLHRDHFQNAEIVPLSKQISQALVRATDSAQHAICRYEVLQNTRLCSMPSIG